MNLGERAPGGGWAALGWRALAALLAAPVSFVAAATAGALVGIALIPISLVTQRDLYLAALSPSYGIAGVAESLPLVVVATVISSVAWGALPVIAPAATRDRLARPSIVMLVGGGVGVVSGGVASALFPPAHWPGGLGWLLWSMALALAGGLGAVTRLLPSARGATGCASDLWRAMRGDAIFAFALAAALVTLTILALTRGLG